MKRLALVVLFLAAARTASASCASPPPGLVWFWPAKNATNIPTNAMIWAIGTGVHVSIDGKDVPPAGTTGIDRYRFDPGPLAPDTTIDVLFTIGEGATTKKVPLTFTTGGQPGDLVPDAPVVSGHTETTASACPGVSSTQGCFDTHDRQLTLAVQPGAPLLSFDSSEGPILWPGDCAPEVWVRSSQTDTCIELKALSAWGSETATTTYCPYAAAAPEGGKKGGGGGSSCSTGAAPAGAVWLLLLLPLLWRRRPAT